MLKEYNVFGDVNRSSAVQSRSSFSVDWHTHEKADAVKRGKPQRNTDEKLNYDIHIDYTNAA